MNWFQELIGELQNLELEQLQDFERVGSWPLALRLLVCLGGFLALLAVGHYLVLAGATRQLDERRKLETELLAQYAGLPSAEPDAYRRRQPELERLLDALRTQIPDRGGSAGLINDLARLGRKHRLAIHSIQLQERVGHELYVEQPVLIRLSGGWHELGGFASDLARLPRLVTLHNFSILPEPAGRKLLMTLNARIYHQSDEEE